MEAVRRRDDDELCGHVDERDGRWRAFTVFGAVLGSHGRKQDAVRQVLDEGLASLAERWILRGRATDEDEVVCIIEANARQVTVARGYYAVAGVPTMTITADQIAAGEWELRR